MPSPNPGFDFRDLAVASGDSCRLLPAFLGNLIERPAVALKHRLLAREPLPPHDRHVDVLCVNVDSVAEPARAFGGYETAARSQERVIHRLARYRVVQDRTTHQ